MRKRLREVAELPPCVRIILLGKKSHIVPQSEQSFEKRASILGSANQVQAVCQPERAEKKNSFRSGQPIHVISLLAIAANETPFH